MSDQVIAAIITGAAGILAALIGLIRWRNHVQKEGGRLIASGNVPPIFDAARVFATYTTLEDKQKSIQPIEVALSHGSVWLTSSQMEYCAASNWELDRIGLYLFEEYTAQPNHAARVLHVQHEFERVSAATSPRSLLPLFYAVRSLLKMTSQQPALKPLVREQLDLFGTIKQYVSLHPYDDPGANIVRLLDKLIVRLADEQDRTLSSAPLEH